MSTPGMFINLFPALVALFRSAAVLVLAAGGVALLGVLAARLLRSRREEAVRRLAAERGLSTGGGAFLGRVFRNEGAATAGFQLDTPDLLRQRLATAIMHRRAGEDAARCAAEASALLDELSLRRAAFDGAPRPYDRLVLRDAADPTARSVTVFVTAVDERSLSVVSPQTCPWPVRRDLLVTPGAGGQPFSAALLLRPVPPGFLWVLTHDLVDVITNRRSAVRVPCRIQTFCLPDSGDPLLLRERLQRDEPLDAETLRRSRGWSQRRAVTVLDISPDGARLAVEHQVSLHQRLHLVLAGRDGGVAALPLAEIVSLTHADDGTVHVGARFVGVRLRERLRLAELARAEGARTPVPGAQSSSSLLSPPLS